MFNNNVHIMNKQEPYQVKHYNKLDKRLEFLFEIYNSGVKLTDEQMALLRSNEYIKQDSTDYERVKPDKYHDGISKDYSINNALERDADSYVDISDNGEEIPDMMTPKEYDKHKQGLVQEGMKEVSTEDWMPKPDEALNYTNDFVKWIDSINKGFSNKIHYKRFELYKQQAQQWFSENEAMSDYTKYDDQLNYARREKKRCTENSLYFLNKYHVLKEGDISSGGRGFKAWECQAVVCYLFDCGHCLFIGKPRQIGFSSVIGGLCMKRIIFHKSYFVKFITKSLQKGEEIFEDKIKFPLYHIPDWMRPTVHNDRDNLLRLFYKPSKGRIGGVESKLEVVAPIVTAINGGAPNLVAIDESGQISILSKMINEGRPALFMVKEDGSIEMRRQLICWGTGGEVDEGGKEFEREFKAALGAWKERNFHYGIIPLFFDAFAKPGVNEEFYQKEKKFYYAKGKDSEVQFHQHYPTCIEDMFLVSSETIWPIEKINIRLSAIYKLKDIDKPKYGYLEPSYNYGQQMPESSDIPYVVDGAVFVPTEDGDPLATTVIFKHPVKGWRNRYFQGTDPIYTETGHSLMASSIWDNAEGTCSATMNYKTEDYRYCYLQALLLGIYYDRSNCRNLVESNVGSGFMDYVEVRGHWNTLVPNNMLSAHLRTSIGQKMGINKRGNTARFILNKLQEMLEVYGENIFIEDFWIQLKTFVRKISNAGHETFKINNKKYDHDDVIDSVVYAYICACSFAHLTPIEENEVNIKKVKYKYEYDGNFNLVLKKVLV